MVHQAVKRCGLNRSSCDVPYKNCFALQIMASSIVTGFTAGSRAVALDDQK
jgi:hypothetical protein